MNSELNHYITEFQTIFNGEPWYGKSLMAVISDADAGKINYKPIPSSHSAFEILEHIYAWRDLFVKRLNGDHKSNITINSKEDWSGVNQNSAEAWKDLIIKLENNQKDLLKALANYKDENLDQPFASTKYSLRVFCNGHIQHDIYHTGQIALLLK